VRVLVAARSPADAPGGWIIGTGWDARLVAVNIDASESEGVADTALRYPSGGGRSVGRPPSRSRRMAATGP
jgi:hypothetical protein